MPGWRAARLVVGLRATFHPLSNSIRAQYQRHNSLAGPLPNLAASSEVYLSLRLMPVWTSDPCYKIHAARNNRSSIVSPARDSSLFFTNEMVAMGRG